jgi:hypothetical protein
MTPLRLKKEFGAPDASALHQKTSVLLPKKKVGNIANLFMNFHHQQEAVERVSCGLV